MTLNALKFNLRAFVFQNFLRVTSPAIPSPPSFSMLPMLIVLCTITCINDPLSSIQAALQLVGLTTKELLPTALDEG